MILSSQTGNLMKSPEGAGIYAPVFRDAGFRAVDFGFTSYVNTYKETKAPLLDSESAFDYFGEISDILLSNGISVGQTHAHYPIYPAVSPLEYKMYAVDLLRKEIELTAHMGAKYIVIHPLCRPLIGSDYDREGEMKDNINMYLALADTLRENGVTALSENMWLTYNGKIMPSFCGSMFEAAELIDRLNNDAGEELYGFCMDTGHAVLTGTPPSRFIKHMAERIKAVHIHDVENNRDSHTAPFLGITDWEDTMDALADIGYKGTLNFEAATAWTQYPEEVYPEAIKLLGAIGKDFVKKYFTF